MNMTILVLASLLFSQAKQGSSAVSPVFVQKGKDVDLEIREADVPEEYIALQWKFNGPQVIVTLSSGAVTVSDSYKGRADASVENFSVKLKNLQKADSGVYTAEVIGTEKSQILAEYHVTVEDPVSPVQLTVDSVSNSSDSCNFTATCITQDSHHINSTFICRNQTCSQEGGERSKVTTSGDFLKIYLVNDLIICNHSNHVSWTWDSDMTEHFCLRRADLKTTHGRTIVICLISFLTAAMAAGSAVYVRQRIKGHEREDLENTVYSLPEVPASLKKTSTDGASGPSLTSTYCLVGPHSGPIGFTDNRRQTLPDSLYSTISNYK